MVTNSPQLSIFDAASGRRIVLASAQQYRLIEGNWYVDPAAVDRSSLKISELEYTCPYKGRCYYVDFDDGTHHVARVAWIYDDPKAGWEHIKGRYGFYAGETAARFGKTKESIA